MILRPLRAVALAAIAERDVEKAFAVENQPRSEVLATSGFGLHAEDHLDILEAVAGEPAADHLCTGAAFTACDVRDIDEAIFRKAWMQGYIEESPLADCGDWRQAGDRLGFQPAVFGDYSELSRAFGNQHPAIGQKCKTPREFQTFGDPDHSESMFLAAHWLRCGGT